MQRDDYTIASLVLPVGVLDFFNLNKVVDTGISFEIHLEEKKEIPEEFKGQSLISKGFYEDATIQDFPIRGKAVYLHVKRRRWVNKDTGNIVCRNWELVSKGTRMTKEFASFLKGIS